MSTFNITLDEAIKVVQEVVAEKGEDHVQEICTHYKYVPAVAGWEPECIAGHAFDRLGLGEFARNFVVAGDVLKKAGVNDNAVRLFFRELQHKADTCKGAGTRTPWGLALREALRAVGR